MNREGAAAAEPIQRSASLSPCGRYRYSLERRWGPGPGALVIGLNPSTADASHDDPTIRRCIGFARAWGYDGFCMVNLFAWRATDPAALLQVADPVGPENDATLLRLAREAAVVVAAWGVHGRHRDRDRAVRRMLPDLHVLRLTKAGHPGHPLYLPAGLRPQRWDRG